MTAEHHKFEESLQVTRLQYYRDAFAQAVSAIRDFEGAFGKEQVHTRVRKSAEESACKGTKAMLLSEGVNIQSLDDFKKNQLEMWENPRVQKTHTCTMTKDSDNEVEFTVTECIWAKVFQGLDATDIGSEMMCATDFAVAKVYNPNLKLVRTQTIMDGHSVCDFRYTWAEE